MSEAMAWFWAAAGLLILCVGLIFLVDRCDQREVACTSQAYARAALLKAGVEP